jgi:hypothetical protein
MTAISNHFSTHFLINVKFKSISDLFSSLIYSINKSFAYQATHLSIFTIFLFFYSHLRNSWVSIDLGSRRRLVPSRFCILHGDTEQRNAVRNFAIQGRVSESDPWVQLKKFRNNKKLPDDCHSTASWGIKRKKSFIDNIIHSQRCDWGSVDQIGFR